MKRFRVTLLAVCLLLGWLGYGDLSLLLRNKQPQQLNIAELEMQQPSQEWLQIDGGHQDLLQAINMSGTMEIDSFLVPLKSSPTSPDIHVWFETRDPQIVELLKTYYFQLNSDLDREKFVEQNLDFIYAPRQVIGMTADNKIARSNLEKLKTLLRELNMQVPDNLVFISEGKEPVALRGYFFVAVALLGLIKVALSFRSRPAPGPAPHPEQD